MARLQKFYYEVVVSKLSDQLGIANSHALPRLTKIVISMGVGKSIQERKRLDEAVAHLALISGDLNFANRAQFFLDASPASGYQNPMLAS